jgi:hypothetical protein
MKFLNLFILVSVAIILGACNNTGTTEKVSDEPSTKMVTQQELWDQVMVVHDEVMPYMGKLNKIQKTLKENREALEDEELKTQVGKAIRDLEKADEGMWDWMHNLKQLSALRKDKTHDEIMTYLSGQLDAITKVKDDMLDSMENGAELLKNFNVEEKK